MSRILIAGGTGFAGELLIKTLQNNGFSIAVLTRKKKTLFLPNVEYYNWDVSNKKIDINAFNNVNCIINFTGANIGEKRWTKARKKEIIESRVESTNFLFEIVEKHQFTIETYISSSAVGYYGAVTKNEIFDEKTPNGNDFLSNVCESWENAACQFEKIATRVVILRKGVIVGNGGMYQKMAPLAKRGINPCLGKGSNYLPWIDVEDLSNLLLYIIQNNKITGVFNAVSSENITLKEFSLKLLDSFKKKSFFPSVPRYIVKIMFGEMSKLLLEGTRISNSKLLNTGFEFKYNSISKSLARLRNEKV